MEKHNQVEDEKPESTKKLKSKYWQEDVDYCSRVLFYEIWSRKP